MKENGLVTLSAALALHPTLASILSSIPGPKGTVPMPEPKPAAVTKKAIPKPPAPAPAPALKPKEPSRLISPEESALARRYFRAGIRFYSVGRLDEAVQSFREGLAHDPNNEWIKNSIERTLAELKLKPPVSKAPSPTEEILKADPAKVSQ